MAPRSCGTACCLASHGANTIAERTRCPLAAARGVAGIEDSRVSPLLIFLAGLDSHPVATFVFGMSGMSRHADVFQIMRGDESVESLPEIFVFHGFELSLFLAFLKLAFTIVLPLGEAASMPGFRSNVLLLFSGIFITTGLNGDENV